MTVNPALHSDVLQKCQRQAEPTQAVPIAFSDKTRQVNES